MKTPIFRLSFLALVAAAAMAAAAADPATRSAKAARAEDAARAARLAAWSEGLRTNANPRTQAQFRDEVFLPFWRRQTVEPFLAGPEGREPWAPEAVRLMEREIFELWNTSLVDCSGTPGIGDARDRSDIVEFVERVRTKDPFLLFLRAAAFREERLRAGALPGGMMGRIAPINQELVALDRIYAGRPDRTLHRFLVAALRSIAPTAGANEWKNEAAAAVEWLKSVGGDPDGARAVRVLLLDAFPRGIPFLATAIDEKPDGIDPWIVRMIRADGAMAGFGTVRPGPGDEDRRRILERARTALEEAWALRPCAPTAVRLVGVCGLLGGDGAEEWLARATEAEIDFAAAYGAYEDTVCRVREKGGAARLRAFADACRDARHDASLPGLCWIAAEFRLARLQGRDPRTLLDDADFAERAGPAASAIRDDGDLHRFSRERAAKFASVIPLLRGDLEDAAAQERARPPRATILYDDDELAFAGDVQTVLSGISGPHSADLIRLERLRLAGDAAATRREAERLLDPAAGLSPAETALAAWRADDARAALEWDSGAWIPVRFSANGAFCNGWNADRSGRSGPGRWTAGDGWADQPGGDSDALRWTVSLPNDVELRGTAVWDERDWWLRPRDFHNLSLDLDPDRADLRQDRYSEVNLFPCDEGTCVSFTGAQHWDERTRSRPGLYLVRGRTQRVDFRAVWSGGTLSVWIGDDPTPFTRSRRLAVAGARPDARDRRLSIEGRGVALANLAVRNPHAPPPADAAAFPPLPPTLPCPPDAEPAAPDPFGLLANARTNAALRTRAAFVRESLAPLLRRELLEPFEAGPEASAPWADEARTFLADSVRLGCYDTLSRRFEWEWEPALRLVLGKGAADPALRWGCAMGLAAQGRKDEAREQVRALREAVAGDGGTPFLRYLAALADWRVDGRARDETARLGVAWAETLADRPQDSRAVLHLLRQDNGTGQLSPLFEASAADPWLAAACRAIEESLAAENAYWRRGAADDGALEQAERFAAARAALERAWALRPDCPEPAYEFANVWRDRLAPAAFERWVRRGLDAQCDHDGLLALCEPFLVPRGADQCSPQYKDALRRFGRALVDTGRFDTQLPAIGVAWMLRGAFRPPAGEELWQVDEDYRRVCDVAGAVRDGDAAGWLEHDRAMGIAAACSRERNDPELRTDPARPLRHALHPGDPINGWPIYLRDFGGTDYLRIHAADYAAALGGRSAAALAKIESAKRGGDVADVLRAADEVLSADLPPLDEHEAGYLFEEWARAWIGTRFASGEPFRLPFLFRGSSRHWILYNGAPGTLADDEAVISKPNRSLEWRVRLPADAAIDGWVAPDPGKAPGDASRFALSLKPEGTDGSGPEFRIRLAETNAEACIAARWKPDEEPVVRIGLPEDGRIPFRAVADHGRLSLRIGGDDGPVVETEAFRERFVGGARRPKTLLVLAGEHVAFGGIVLRAPLGAAPGEEQPEGALPRFRTVLLPGGVPLELAWCPAGSFEEGFWELERQGWTGENPAPRRTAELTRGFWIARCETTRAQWRAAMGGDAPGDGEPDAPVAASWDEAAAFAERLGAVAPQEGLRWALPTETQWERAARAGREGPLDPVALGEAIAPAAGAGPRPAGAARANPWGVWDLCGNAREWCADDYAPRASIDPVRDPPPARLAPGAPKAVRGGAADSAHPAELSPGFRAGRVRELRVPSIGFRVILEE
ncbi:MAG: SUMF1/EgtB/PvdO family nonheme iron enzyme [Kiritimatiellae bacterium]|nr:SUMF1/EgtB/PvdO family nonheme iron enzyme [Kiritimatiellia bacterium]